MTYYRGMGATPRRSVGLDGLGMTESERIRRNAVAEQMAAKKDGDALKYLQARSRYISSFTVKVGAPYEPEGGTVVGWATSSARTDAANRLRKVTEFLAWSGAPPSPPPDDRLNPVPPPTPGPPPPPSGTDDPLGPDQPELPKVEILAPPGGGPPVMLLALAAVAALLVFAPSRSRGA